MKAMILAAGRGERMQHLSADTPKPLLPLRHKALIEHRIEALIEAGVNEIIINLFYLGEKIADYLGTGQRYGVKIKYSWEKEKLDVGGGIQNALPLLGNEPFILTSADIDTDYAYQKLTLPENTLAHLVLTNNPPHHPFGDFSLDNGIVGFNVEQTKLTYMNIAIFHPDLFRITPPGKNSFLACLTPAINAGKVSGEYYSGYWLNMDTPERLLQANQR